MILRSLFTAVLFTLISSSSFALCVTADKANLRYGPSTKHQKTWEVYKYMPFQQLKAQKDWYRVKDVDGDIHWIFNKLVTKKYKCAVVNVKKANLREGPTTKSKKVNWGPAQKYYAFRVLKQKGKWLNVVDAAGGKAWVHTDLVWVK